MFIGKYPAKAYRNGQHIGPGPWLELVRESGIFGAPTSIEPWKGGPAEVEEYPDARIIHAPDGDMDTVMIVAKTMAGDIALVSAEEHLREEAAQEWQARAQQLDQ